MSILKNGYLQLAYYSLFNGFVGVFVKKVQALDTLSVVFFRALIAVAFIGLVCLILREPVRLRRKHLRSTLMVGLFQGIMTMLIMGALGQTSVANALFLLYTAPIFTILLARIFLKEQIANETWVGIAVAILGVFLIVDPNSLSLHSRDMLGSMMALGAGLALAAMTVAAKPLSRQVSGYYIVFWQYLFVAMLALPFVRVDSANVLMANWWQLAGLGIVCTGIAFLWYMGGVRCVPAQHVLVVASLEPLVGTLIAVAILHESLSSWAILGATLIIVGAYWVSRTGERVSSAAAGPEASQFAPQAAGGQPCGRLFACP